MEPQKHTSFTLEKNQILSTLRGLFRLLINEVPSHVVLFVGAFVKKVSFRFFKAGVLTDLALYVASILKFAGHITIPEIYKCFWGGGAIYL